MRIRLPDGVADTEGRWISTGGQRLALREKEARLLEVLASSPGEVIDRDTLNARVFDYGPTVASRTLDTTVRRLRQKLEEVGAGELVQTVYGQGYRFVPLDAPSETTSAGYEQAERALIDALRRPGTVVVTGPAGVGKTSLVQRVLRGRADVVEVSCSTPSLVSAVLTAAGMPSAPADLAGEALTLRPGLCLVLDDAEHLDADGLQDALSWFAAAPELRLVLVGRRRLGLPQAAEVVLDGLEPDAARALFLATARIEDGPAVDELMPLLGREPLALLLAAHRVRALGLEAFALHLRSRPQGLTGDALVPERHRSLPELLRATLALVSTEAVAALARMAAVEHPLDAPTLAAVVGPDALERVAELVDAHLVVREGADFVVHPRTRAHVRAEG
ncbi:MAG: winged helix-turn-helix domain-containing protein, partial [Myxococcales bacterium]|nr:winged helix-turn-helix domain-containing protein [Myxococcales bacterium]